MAAANLLAACLMTIRLPAGPAMLAWILWAGFIAVRFAANARARQPVRLRFDVSGACRWQEGGAEPVNVDVLRVTRMGTALTVLELRRPGGGHCRVAVAADSLPAARHRALRVAATTGLRGYRQSLHSAPRP